MDGITSSRRPTSEEPTITKDAQHVSGLVPSHLSSFAHTAYIWSQLATRKRKPRMPKVTSRTFFAGTKVTALILPRAQHSCWPILPPLSSSYSDYGPWPAFLARKCKAANMRIEISRRILSVKRTQVMVAFLSVLARRGMRHFRQRVKSVTLSTSGVDRRLLQYRGCRLVPSTHVVTDNYRSGKTIVSTNEEATYTVTTVGFDDAGNSLPAYGPTTDPSARLG